MIQKYILFLACILVFACTNDTKVETTQVTTSSPKVTESPATDKPAATKNSRFESNRKSPIQKTRKPRLVFFGNSLAAGYGLPNPQDGFVGLLAQRILGAGINYQVENGGLSGETTAGGLERIDWYLKRPLDIIVIELGGNDGLRGIDPASTKQNLQGIINKVRASSPEAKIVLAGMEAPPNMGETFTSNFRKLYKELATENDVRLIPFLLEGVAGEPKLNLPDGIHPNPEGHRKVANNVWHYIQNLL